MGLENCVCFMQSCVLFIITIIQDKYKYWNIFQKNLKVREQSRLSVVQDNQALLIIYWFVEWSNEGFDHWLFAKIKMPLRALKSDKNMSLTLKHKASISSTGRAKDKHNYSINVFKC